jgi:PEGA domain
VLGLTAACARAPTGELDAGASGRASYAVPCEVSSTPADAGLFVDGRAVGATPATVELRSDHESEISVRLAGYVRAVRAVQPDPRLPPVLHFQLTPGVTLDVSTQPAGAEVQVQGALAIPSTPGRSEAQVPGPLEVVVHKEGYVDVLRVLQATDAGVLALEFDLVPAAVLRVRSAPPGAQVLVDGLRTPFSTPADVTLTPSLRHKVSVTAPGFSTVTRLVAAGKAGSRAELEVTLVDLARAELQRRVARAEAALERARAGVEAARAREEASELAGRTLPALVRALRRAEEGVSRAQDQLDEADAARDRYDASHEDAAR